MASAISEEYTVPEMDEAWKASGNVDVPSPAANHLSEKLSGALAGSGMLTRNTRFRHFGGLCLERWIYSSWP